MEYTTYTLAACGLFGILIHNLMKLNDLNRANDGNINFRKYLKLEVFSILISFCVVIIALIARNEIKQLHDIGNWLALAFTAIGYMAQSIVIKFAGRAQKYMDNQDRP